MNNDLISREAAIAQIERRKSLLVGDKTVSVDAFIKFLKNRPAVDAEPIRHGRWIKRGYACGESEWMCSACGEKEWRTSISRFKGCPFCRAKMDGGADDGTAD